MVSSGQARVIALTARINDIEFQGQQINQQRTTLANKSSEYYNSLLDMDVPTPPSKTDYTVIEYSGNFGASKFKIKNVSPKDNGKYNIRVANEVAGLSMKRSTRGATVVQTPSEIQATKLSQSDIDLMLAKDDLKYATVTPGKAYGNQQVALADDPEKDVLLYVKVSDYKAWIAEGGAGCAEKDNVRGIYNKDGKPVKDIDSLKDDDYVYVRCNLCEVTNTSPYQNLVKSGDKIDYSKVYRIASEEKYETLNGTYSIDSKVLEEHLYSVDSNGVVKRIATAADLQDAIYQGYDIYDSDCANGGDVVNLANPYYKEGQNSISLKDKPNTQVMLMSSDDAHNALKNEYESFLTALSNRFNDKYSKEEIANAFYVYFDADTNNYTFIEANKISSIKEQDDVETWVFDESGTYNEYITYEDSTVNFDVSTGMIKEIGVKIGGKLQFIEVTANEVTDDEAYEAADKEYSYQKYLYDKKQNDINAKLSIVQAEDKNLELKLTRLDNERNALNTELEAVKKVVKEGTERGAKTFNG